MFLSSFAVSPHPSLLLSFYFPLLTVAVTRLRSDLLGKLRPVCPYERRRRSQVPAQGGRPERWIVKRMWTLKNWRRADDVLHAGSVSLSCFLSPRRAVLVWDEQIYRRGGKTGGRIKGNSVRAKCAKTLVRNGLWVMKKSPRMHCKSGKWCFSFMVVGKCWKAIWFVIRRISRNTNALKQQPLVKVIQLSVTFGHNWRC